MGVEKVGISNDRDVEIDFIEPTNEDLEFDIHWYGDTIILNFDVYEVIYQDNSGTRYYSAAGWVALPTDTTSDISKAEKYLTGTIRFDGCTEVSTEGQHWCGKDGFEAQVELISYIYTRSLQLMRIENFVT